MTPRLLLVAALVACGGAPRQVRQPEHDDAPPSLEHKPVDDVVTLSKLEQGDRACYVTVVGAGGTPATLVGDFALCPNGENDAAVLVGKRVRFATRKDKIQAMSCQGNPDCTDAELVDLVITIVPAP